MCLLFNDFTYYAISDAYGFFNRNDDFSFILMVFAVIYITLNIFLINNLIEEKQQIYKYIYVRNHNNAVKKYFVKMLKEISLICLSKIVCDFIFWISFDRYGFITFVRTSVELYLTVLLWLILFDFLSGVKINNNIVTLIMIASIVLSNMLINYSTFFSLLTIIVYGDTVNHFEIMLFKFLVLLIVLFCDIRVRTKKEYY